MNSKQVKKDHPAQSKPSSASSKPVETKKTQPTQVKTAQPLTSEHKDKSLKSHHSPKDVSVAPKHAFDTHHKTAKKSVSTPEKHPTQPTAKVSSSTPAAKESAPKPQTKSTPTTSGSKIQPASGLKPAIFAVKVNRQAIFDVVLSERASQRQGTHKVKNRAEVRGGGAKPWRQKGTGRARAGSNRSPIWVGGGVVFGPTPNVNYQLKVNKQVRKLAFLSALTLKAKQKAVFVHDFKIAQPSTKNFLKQLANLALDDKMRKLLFVGENEKLALSLRNLPDCQIVKPNSVHVSQIIGSDAVIFSPDALTSLERMAS
ncbi:50S ribosomal protein L4 [Mycoplasma sp. ATU-Cv-508]|uniref:50S ribosomal protein L4 n=1 Tax=Mycoplasma sp. ATU-Cv-508 TaxID=2048001 RepID=UPI000FDE851E